jgi:hypothetical protein
VIFPASWQWVLLTGETLFWGLPVDDGVCEQRHRVLLLQHHFLFENSTAAAIALIVLVVAHACLPLDRSA